MKNQKQTQKLQVVEAMRNEGGFATLRRLYELLDFSTWKTKTPEATVRRIVQISDGTFFKVRPGLWALQESRDKVFEIFELQAGNKHSEEQFSHSYYQGLLVEIGKFYQQTTYVPPQDQNRKFIATRLGDIADTTVLPSFSYEELLRKARTVDVIWFNVRNMPSNFYEVEHTTDFKNSLSKFYELQDFFAGFYIVADNSRRAEFEDKLHLSMFKPIDQRVKFLDYKRIVSMYEGLARIAPYKW